MESKFENIKSQPLKNIAHLLDELISFEHNLKAMYEKVTDDKTKGIVTEMFQDFGSKLKQLGDYLMKSEGQAMQAQGNTQGEDNQQNQQGEESQNSDEDADTMTRSTRGKKAKTASTQTSV